jgi:DNA invertase Pin-like site-specific DNA recombinase
MGELIGYCRASSLGQSVEIQVEQLKAAGCTEIFAEKRSGTSLQGREQLEQAMRFVRRGDVLMVTRLDRLARSIADLSRIIDGLTAKEVGFRCLQQGSVDTTSPEGRLMLQVLGAMAEFETAIRKERQKEGIEKARAEGRYRGRPKSIDAQEVRRLLSTGMGPTAVARTLGIGRASIYRVAKREGSADQKKNAATA